MNEEQNTIIEEEKQSSIDYAKIFSLMKKHKKTYKKVLPITFVLACFFMLCLPKTYTCEVMLAPELSTRSSTSGTLGALAAQFGMKVGSGALGNEALFPTLYPDLMNSTDFKASLFNIPIHRLDSTRIMSYYDYLAYEQKMPFWSAGIKAGVEFLIDLLPLEEDTIDQHKVDPFMLTKEQTQVVKMIDKKVVCDVDQKTMVITITVKDQDPLICATIADSVKVRLQDFITDYRTHKAKVDLEYNKKLYAEAKERYDKARRLYASFADANQEMILQSARTKLIDLENDMQLKYNAYTMVANQLTAAEAKVQEDTPAFTTLQSATVPVKKSGPKRIRNVLIILFLAFCCTTARILHKEGELIPLLGLG